MDTVEAGKVSIRKLAQPLGAEISGIDVGQPMSDATFKRIEDAFHEHCVVAFRGQRLTPAPMAASNGASPCAGNESCGGGGIAQRRKTQRCGSKGAGCKRRDRTSRSQPRLTPIPSFALSLRSLRLCVPPAPLPLGPAATNHRFPSAGGCGTMRGP